MDNRYDIAIIGSGPAGLSAAVNANIRNKNLILFGNAELSHKLVKAPKINNYLGFHDITGLELKEKFQQHIEEMAIHLTNEKVNTVYAMGDYFVLQVNEKMYEATAVVIATGMEFTRPLKGETEFLGKGVGYCATCDAPLYKGKIVSIVAYNKEGEEEANFVSELASKVYYIPMYKGEYKLNSNIHVVKDIPLEILGGEYVEMLKLSNTEIKTDGVFMLKDSVAPDQLVPGLLIEGGHIKVDRNMKTNIDRCYAAGDCAGKPYQYLKSAGEGQVAALSAVSYLDSKNKSI
jgi:thioredoxin reductase (NADPH)